MVCGIDCELMFIQEHPSFTMNTTMNSDPSHIVNISAIAPLVN